MLRRFPALGLVLTAIAASGFQSINQNPAFHAGVNLIQLDVSVLDKKTHLPVRGLKQADFTIREDDTFHKVEAFAAIEVPDPPPTPVVDGQPVTWLRDVAPDVQSNATAAAPESRLFVLVIDDAMIPLDPFIVKQTRTAAIRIIDKLSPADRMAVVLTAQSIHAQDFTTDRAKLKAAVEKMRPGFAQYLFGWENWAAPPGPTPTGLVAWQPPAPLDGDINFREMSFGTLTAVADALMAAPDRRKTVIYLSTGIPVNPGWAASFKAADGSLLVNYEANKRLVADMPELFRRMQRANINVYAIDPSGLDGMAGIVARALLSRHAAGSDHPDPLTGQSKSPPLADEFGHFVATQDLNFLLAAAENTGGRAIVNTNDLEPGIEEMFRENGSYYLLGYTAPPNDPPGSLHRIKVVVNRPDVEVRTRSGFYTPKPEVVDPKKPVITPMQRAVAKLLPSADLPLRVVVAPVVWIPPPPMPTADASGRMKKPGPPPGPTPTTVVVLGLERPAPDKPLSDSVEVQISAFTPDGYKRGTDTQIATIAIRPSTTQEPVRYEALSRVDLPPGRYQLRIAAYSAVSNVTGSVYADVEIPDFAKEAVSMSGVFLSAVPGPRSSPRETLASIVPVIPTSERTFQKLDQASAFLRVYQGGTDPVKPVSITTRLVTDRNVALVNRSDVLETSRFNPVTRGADHRFEIPMLTLARGQYLLQFEATFDGHTARRDVRFTVR